MPFEHSKQLGLHVERELADLVEEQSAAVGTQKCARALANRTCERTPLVTEQLAFDELARDGAAIDGDEGSGAAARAVQAFGGELFARAGLALDENREVGGGDSFEQREDLAHRSAGAEHAAEASARRDLLLDRLGERLEAHGRLADA